MASSSGFVPRRRPNGLVTEHLDGEVLLYVEATHKAFCLNPPAARIWESIDGTRDVTGIARRTALEPELVTGTLQEMGEAGLLESIAELSASGVDLSRRRLVRAGLVALPFILAITVPRAAEAASCTTGAGGPGGPCRPSKPCCTGICNEITGTCG